MKIIIAGSRSLTPSKLQIAAALNEPCWFATEIVSGRAQGVDMAGEIFAEANDIPIKPFPADWGKFGKRAGFLRNAEMAKYADALLAFWDGQSPGTKSMIQLMLNIGKPFVVRIIH